MKAGSVYNKLNDSYESDEADTATLGHANTQEHSNIDSNRQRIAQDPPPVSEQKIEPNQQHECAPMIDHDFANFEEGFSEQNDSSTETNCVQNEDFTSNLAHMHAGSIQFTPSLRTKKPDENIHGHNTASAGDPHLPLSKDGSSSGSSVTRFFTLTKKPKKVREPKVKASGIINYGISSDSESDVSSISTQSKGYELPYDMSNAMQYSQVRFDDGKDADDNSIRTPIPTKPPEPGLVLPSSFLRDRNVSTVSDLSEEETSVVKRKRREDENVGRLVQAAKQQQSFAQAWFNAGKTLNFLPPRPPKKGMSSNAPVDLKKKKRSGEESSGPIDLDSGDVWGGEDDSDQGEVGSKTNWEIGSFNFTTHSGTTKKRRNRRGKGIPDDEELTAYYQAKCGDRTVCTLGRIRCSLLALIIVTITILIAIGATFAGIYIPRFTKIIVESAAPSTSPMPTTSPPSISPSLRPSTTPSFAPSSIPSSQPSKMPTTSPSISPTISLQPSSKPSSSPTTYFADETFVPFGTRIQHPLPQTGDEFGYVVEINKEGNIIAIGSDNPSGSSISVVLFELLEGGTNPEYIQKGNVINGLEAALGSDRLSMDLSSDGLSIIIGEKNYNGSKGAVRVFNFNELSSEWERIGDILEEPEKSSFSPPFFGSSVSISDDGKTVAVGAPNIDWGDGKAYLYRHENGVWILNKEFESKSIAFESSFGSAVALSGDGKVLACGAEKGILNTSVGIVSQYGQGFARVYKFDDFFETWEDYDISYTGELEAVVFPLANFGHTISVSEDGSKLVIGAYTDSINGQENVGSVYVYSFRSISGTYELESKLSGNRKDTFFGTSTTISRSGDFLAVGTQNPETNGSVIAYRYSEGGDFWDASVALEGDDGDYLGQSVALTTEITVGGDEKVMLIVGSPNKKIESAGSARVFEWNS
ncbi:hypothetical protein CTEN210_07484 [Chaetoceros tenuissimus]|uniref:Uncharacterized protein n=1 Tax=Chaetoceros tenuissimus TaxID=426638 RepID=A0AAD3CRU8_9STRA|nr:hypothetical protein CTEN210_07484 [Chaetoceros tenuissimus]